MQSMRNNTKKDIRVRYGAVVKTLRKKRGLSQEELGALSRLHRTYISDIEGGGRNVSLLNVEKIARALGVPIDKMFIGL